VLIEQSEGFGGLVLGEPFDALQELFLRRHHVGNASGRERLSFAGPFYGPSDLTNLARYCHRKYMPNLKEQRLQIRVDPADKALLELAAAAAHLNLSAFVVQAAAARAEEVLAERASIRLSPDAARAFSDALERPGEVNERLARALQRERKFSWLD
jgi:uncharacterized protein (DUF1778 family)